MEFVTFKTHIKQHSYINKIILPNRSAALIRDPVAVPQESLKIMSTILHNDVCSRNSMDGINAVLVTWSIATCPDDLV